MNNTVQPPLAAQAESPPKSWQSPCPAPLGPRACEFIQGSEGVKARAHVHIPPQQCLPADLIPTEHCGVTGMSREGCGACWSNKPLTCTFGSAHVTAWQWQTPWHSSVLIFFPFSAIWRRFYLPFPHPSRHPMPVSLKPAFRVSVLVRD